MQLAHSQFAPGYGTACSGDTRTIKPVQAISTIGPIVRWSFYAFIFSLLFEVLPIGISLEATQVTGGFLILAALLFQPRRCFLYPPAAFWCFVVYLWIGLVTLGFNHALFDSAIILRLFKLLQLIVLFWIAYNLMRDERTATGALLSLVASSAVMSLMSALGLTTTNEDAVSRLGRLTAFGLDSNQLAGVLALGILALVGVAYGFRKELIHKRFLIWPVVALIGVTMVQTGSRGALLALGSGVLVFILRKGTVLAKLRNALVIILGVGAFFWIAYQSEMVRNRVEATVEDGSLSERENVYPMAWEMFLEKPVLGWGPGVNSVELGNRVGLPNHERMDAHNLILYVLTATGIVGAIPFFAGVGLCVRGAWKARGSINGILPLAMTACLLVADMSVSGLNWKQHWLVLAYALASASQFVMKSQRVRSKPFQALPAGATAL